MKSALAERPPHIPPARVVDFDIYHPPGVDKDFHGAWATLQTPGIPDLVWTPHNGGHWIPTRLRVIEKVLADYEHFSTRVIILPREAGEKLPLIPSTLQPPEHRHYRAILNSSLSPKAITGIEGRIRELVIELIENVREQGRCDFTKCYAEILPIEIFMEMMNLPIEDVPQAKYWSDQVVRPDGSMTFEAAVQRLFDYLEPYVDARMGGAGTDMLSRIVNGRVFHRALTKVEAMQTALQVMLGGLDTVVNIMGFVMLSLAQSRTHRQELVESPGLIPTAVEELFRRFPVVTNAREVVSDFEFEGVPLRKGEMIAVPTTLGGIDNRVVDRPLEIDFHRSSGEHVTFGKGIHKCPGAQLARTEIRITVEEWLRRIPVFRVAQDAEPTFSGGVVGVVNSLILEWDVDTTKPP